MDSTTTAVNTALNAEVLSQVKALNLGVNNAALLDIVDKVVAQTSTSAIQQTQLSANQQLTAIPQNLIGVNNPVNIVSQNFSSQGITNTLSNPLQTQLAPGLTDSLVSNLTAELKRILPQDKLNLVNFGTIGDTLLAGLGPHVETGIVTALTGFTDSLFNKGISPPPTLQNVEGLFDTLTSEEALIAIDEQFASTTASKYLTQASNFDVNSTENQEKLIVTKVGFTDPNANYPTKEYAGSAETNKLAQGDVRGTIVQTKNLSRMLGAKLPGGDSWDQPESAFKGEYPYNKVTQTESGHVIEIDDTPGAERLHIYHRSGTFVEIDANGSMVKRAAGSTYEIIDRNGKISIAGQADISINGACNIFVGNDANIEVEGDTNITCHNDITAQAGGVLNLSAAEEINITSPVINIQAYEEMHLKSNVLLSLHATEDINLKANADVYLQSVNLYKTATTSYLEAEAIYEKASGSIYNQAGDKINLKSSSTINLDGSATYLQSGTAADSADSLPATVADSSNIGILPGRKDIQYIELDDPVSLTMVDSQSLLLEESTQTDSEVRAQKDLVITSGFATAAGFGAAPIVIESSSPSSNQNIVVPPAESLKSCTILPGNYKLSPNFTLENVTNKTACTKDILVGTSSYSYGELVYNLQAIALNILEPVYALYPNMFVTSGFRDPGNASNAKTSQHPKGQAVDLQFRGIAKKDYYNIALKLAKVLNYDQMILEYCHYTNNPWIHVSYSVKDTNRKQVLTFIDHKTFAQGLSNLA